MLKKQNYYYSDIDIYPNILHCHCSLAVTAKETLSAKKEMDSLESPYVHTNTKRGLI